MNAEESGEFMEKKLNCHAQENQSPRWGVTEGKNLLSIRTEHRENVLARGVCQLYNVNSW